MESFFETASDYCEEKCTDEIEWANSINESTFDEMTSEVFLYNYCWVVFASGFRCKIVKDRFPSIQKAYKNFDLEKMSRMRSVTPVLTVFNNKNKVNCFLRGAKAIHAEGYEEFKERIKEKGMDGLTELPYIKKVTKYHLAKNIGLLDTAKPDVWLIKIATKVNANVDELINYLMEVYGLSAHTIDIILWRYCADNEREAKKNLKI